MTVLFDIASYVSNEGVSCKALSESRAVTPAQARDGLSGPFHVQRKKLVSDNPKFQALFDMRHAFPSFRLSSRKFSRRLLFRGG